MNTALATSYHPSRMKNHRDPSAVSQVHEWLTTLNVGQTIFSAQAHEALPHLKPIHISAALSLLSQPQYGILLRLERVGRLRPYQLTKHVREHWNGHVTPCEHTRCSRDGTEPAARSTSCNELRSQVSDLLLEAAELAENHDQPDEAVLDAIRTAYFKLKKS